MTTLRGRPATWSLDTMTTRSSCQDWPTDLWGVNTDMSPPDLLHLCHQRCQIWTQSGSVRRKWDKSVTFSDLNSVHIGITEAKYTKIGSEKVPDLSQFGVNLNQFGSKSDIRDVHNMWELLLHLHFLKRITLHSLGLEFRGKFQMVQSSRSFESFKKSTGRSPEPWTSFGRSMGCL